MPRYATFAVTGGAPNHNIYRLQTGIYDGLVSGMCVYPMRPGRICCVFKDVTMNGNGARIRSGEGGGGRTPARPPRHFLKFPDLTCGNILRARQMRRECKLERKRYLRVVPRAAW